MGIWFTATSVEALNTRSFDTIVDHIGIEYIEIGEDYIKARMPVDRRTVQPARILHGGASLVLAETLGSISAYLCIDPERKMAVGLEINANHVRAVREGFVTGTATPLHIGSSTQIWQIHIRDDLGRLVCISRITMAVLDKTYHSNQPPRPPE
jgi:1,4-dihydroxy-2-naphthoyl-CoA hydrolase